jgi:flavorubredoxin
MDTPKMLGNRSPAPETEALVSYFPIPGFGILPVNAFVLRAAEPMLVDTGLAALRQDFMESLRSAVDPQDLRWIWLTHTDADHIGNLQEVLAQAPKARLVTTFLGMGKMSLLGLPLDRAYLLNPGQTLDLGDRRIRALRPPTYDAPETTALFDEKTRILYSADAFGALMQEPADTAADIQASALRDGARTWATIDAPWLSAIEEGKLRASLAGIRELEPELILSAHLPTAEGRMTELLCDQILAARELPPFEGPDQAALERMMTATG